MAYAEFEEKQYETAFIAELSSARGLRYFSAGQVLEGVLGFDGVAYANQYHPIWNLLCQPRPRGIVLIPQHFPNTQPSSIQNSLPKTPVSLILQYKRPEYLFGHNARQWPHWRRGYFRFKIKSHQQQILDRLESLVRTDAVVRYAAPSFWRSGDLEGSILNGQVLGESGFVAPSVLRGHTCWTYVVPGSVGWANPEGEDVMFESLDDLNESVRSIGEMLSPKLEDISGAEATVDHLRLMGEAARRVDPVLESRIVEWKGQLDRVELDAESFVVNLLTDIASIASFAKRVGGTWLLTGSNGSYD